MRLRQCCDETKEWLIGSGGGEARRAPERATVLAAVKGSRASRAGSAALDGAYARARCAIAGDGQRDAAGGGSELGMGAAGEGATGSGPVSGLMATSVAGRAATGAPCTKRSG